MTDKTKYSNISVSKRTYADLQKLAKGILPGRTSLSISKTVDVLVNEKLQENVSSLITLAEAEKLPKEIIFDLSALEASTTIFVRDITLPEGFECDTKDNYKVLEIGRLVEAS